MAAQTGDDGTKDVEVMVSLKCLRNLWKSLEIPSINWEINLIVTWSTSCVIVSTAVICNNQAKLYVPVVIFSTQDNAKLLQHLKSGFKRIINWN